jgi:hypothetical protein
MAEIISSSPLNGETEVAIGSTIQVTFDTAMDPASITTRTLVLYDQDTNIIDGTITYNGTTLVATFTPLEPLLVRHDYTFVVLGGENGVHTLPDMWGETDYLPSNYQFTFTTNDGRFLPTSSTPFPSGVDPDILYPSGVTYYTPFDIVRTIPTDRATNISPSGVFLNASGLPTITIYFNKPVSPDMLDGTDPTVDGRHVSITTQNVLQDPFIDTEDLSHSGSWSVIGWRAIFTFDTNVLFDENEEIDVTIPSSIRATDGSSLVDGEDYEFYFTTRYNPLYIGVAHVRLVLGNIIDNVPDDTINRLIHTNSLLANWYSRERPGVIQPFPSNIFEPSVITTTRPAFIVNPVTGAPRYVKEYVLAKTCLDLLKARFFDYVDGVMLGGGPGASKSLDDLRITEGNGMLYAATVGPLINKLEGDYLTPGSVAYWLAYITGKAKWKPGFKVAWGAKDPRNPPKRTDWITGTGGGTTSTGTF